MRVRTLFKMMAAITSGKDKTMGSPGEEASTAGRYHLYRRGIGSLQEKGTACV